MSNTKYLEIHQNRNTVTNIQRHRNTEMQNYRYAKWVIQKNPIQIKGKLWKFTLIQTSGWVQFSRSLKRLRNASCALFLSRILIWMIFPFSFCLQYTFRHIYCRYIFVYCRNSKEWNSTILLEKKWITSKLVAEKIINSKLGHNPTATIGWIFIVLNC